MINRLPVFLVVYLLFSALSVADSRHVHLYDSFAKSVDLEYTPSGTTESTRLPMTPAAFGVWDSEITWPAGDYEYRFVIDGKLPISDISNREFVRRDDGSIWSRLTIANNGDSSSNSSLSSETSSPRMRITHVRAVN